MPGAPKKSARRRFLLHPVRSVFFAADAATETLLETVDTTTGIHNFLLASIERVALGNIRPAADHGCR